MSPMLKYRDPNDGLWKPVPVGGSAPTQVDAGATAPTFTTDGIWADTTGLVGTAAPDPASPPASLYAYDSAGGLWTRAGASQSDLDGYLPLVGGTIAPGPLNLPAPGAGVAAARYADAIPRFPDAAARDAFYAALPGGPQAGMICYLLNANMLVVFDGALWRGLGLMSGSGRGRVVWAGSQPTAENVKFSPVYNNVASVTPPPLQQVTQTPQGLVLPLEMYMPSWTVEVAVSAGWTAPAVTVLCNLTQAGTVISEADTRYIVNQYGDDICFTFVIGNWVDDLSVQLTPVGGPLTFDQVILTVNS